MIHAHHPLTLGDAPGGLKGVAVVDALEHGGKAVAGSRVELHLGFVTDPELGATLEAGNHGYVVGFSHEDRVTGAVERLGLHGGDLIGRQNLQVQGVGHIGER